MTTFEYRGFDAGGRAVRGLLEATDPKRARAVLLERGITAETVVPAAGAAASSAKMRLPMEARAAVYHELSALLAAGVPLVGALDVVLRSPMPPARRLGLAALRDGIREGGAMSAVLARLPLQSTPMEAAVLEVGEKTGTLAQSLDRLATLLEERSALRERAVSALLYPATVVVVALLLGAGVMLFLLPRMEALLADAEMPVPLFTRILFSGGRILGGVLLAVLAAAGIAAVVLKRRVRQSPALAAKLDRALGRIPVLGPARRESCALSFLQVLSLMIERGVSLVEALPLAARASGSDWLAAEIDRETAALAHGKPLADVFRDAAPLPPALAGWVAAGQSGGDLSGLLSHAAAQMRRSWERRTGRALVLLETGLTILIGVFVALVALAVILPVLQMNHGLAR